MDGNFIGKFFLKRAEQRRELVRKISVIQRQIQNDKTRNKTESDLLCDEWEFHRGPADTPEKKNRMMSDVNALRVVQRVKEKLAEKSTEQSSLMDGFDDEPFGDLPSDEHLADEICKNNPDMKQYRKDLI
jgi:hypothetical protein